MGNYSYITEWKTAIERTERFGLKLPDCRLQSEKRYLTPQFIQEFPYILQKELGVIEKNEVISQCLTFHLRILPILQKHLECGAYFTIGWIDILHTDFLFKFDDLFIEKSIKNKGFNKNINIHSWITLDSMEIIDATFSTTIAMAQKNENGYGGIIMQHDDTSKGLFYMPMLVGDDFLVKSGAMKFISIIY